MNLELTIRIGPTAHEQKSRKKATIFVAKAGGQIYQKQY